MDIQLALRLELKAIGRGSAIDLEDQGGALFPHDLLRPRILSLHSAVGDQPSQADLMDAGG